MVEWLNNTEDCIRIVPIVGDGRFWRSPGEDQVQMERTDCAPFDETDKQHKEIKIGSY